MLSSDHDPVCASFQLAQLFARQQASGQPWLQFLEVSTMRAGLYRVPAGGVDEQKPHDQDELYYVISGRGVLRVEAENLTVGPGSLVFVRAQAPHRFHSVSEDLQALVFFAAAERRHSGGRRV